MKKLLPILILTILIISSTSAQAGKGRVNVAVSPAPPALSMSIGFEEPSGNNMLDAAETGKLVVTVKTAAGATLLTARYRLSQPNKFAAFVLTARCRLGRFLQAKRGLWKFL